jgi:hypothetical protein
MATDIRNDSFITDHGSTRETARRTRRGPVPDVSEDPAGRADVVPAAAAPVLADPEVAGAPDAEDARGVVAVVARAACCVEEPFAEPFADPVAAGVLAGAAAGAGAAAEDPEAAGVRAGVRPLDPAAPVAAGVALVAGEPELFAGVPRPAVSVAVRPPAAGLSESPPAGLRGGIDGGVSLLTRPPRRSRQPPVLPELW